MGLEWYSLRVKVSLVVNCRCYFDIALEIKREKDYDMRHYIDEH